MISVSIWAFILSVTAIEIPVLITGEPGSSLYKGTGQPLTARAFRRNIRARQQRAKKKIAGALASLQLLSKNMHTTSPEEVLQQANTRPSSIAFSAMDDAVRMMKRQLSHDATTFKQMTKKASQDNVTPSSKKMAKDQLSRQQAQKTMQQVKTPPILKAQNGSVKASQVTAGLAKELSNTAAQLKDVREPMKTSLVRQLKAMKDEAD